MTVQPITHIQCDERGVAWIGQTNTKVIEVAAEHAGYGWEAEEIHPVRNGSKSNGLHV